MLFYRIPFESYFIGGILKMKKNILATILILVLFISCGKKSTEPEPVSAPQIISGPVTNLITATDATITWKTNQTSNSILQIGQSSNQYDSTLSSNELVTNHSMTIEKLAVYTSYYYIVISSNENGADTSAENLFTTLKDAQLLSSRAWSKFEKGQYLQAIHDFELALTVDSNHSDAYTGLGWSYSFLDSLNKAKEKFDNAISISNVLLDAYVGRGMVFLSKKKYYSCVTDLNFVLEHNSNYMFNHYTNIDYKDIHVALAEAFFYQSKFNDAQQHVDFLLPDNGLDPDNSATWLVDSVSFATYQEALLSAIEKLKSLV